MDFEKMRNQQAVESARKFAKGIVETGYTTQYGRGYMDACEFILMLLPEKK